MNAPRRPLSSLVARLAGATMALLVALLPTDAAAAKAQTLRMTVAQDRRSVQVTVPADCTSVTIQRLQTRGWTDVVTVAATPGTLRVDLPDLGRRARLRAIVAATGTPGVRGKFPEAFYRGRNSFDPSFRGNSSALRGLAVDYLTPNAAKTADLEVGSGGTSEPVEADIWKVEGTTVYYFNQLRGLQVLDLTNPADPRMVATLRLPAVGQDLYLLPGSGPTRHLVLLTRGDAGYGKAVFHLVKVSGGQAVITHSREVEGELMDSRMAGNRLFLLTSLWSSPVYTGGVLSSASTVTTTISEWLCNPDSEPVAAGETVVSGTSPVVAAGTGWLALAVTPPGEWGVSDVHVFQLAAGGLSRLTAQPVRTEGRVADKFKVQWSNGVLTTISQRNSTSGVWSPTTVLETWRAEGPASAAALLGRLELAQGESLFATRFAGDKAYVVTFLRTDPLWVVDLSDPAAPSIAGHLEVPGWSTHLEPVGDLLFSIGWEGGTIAASLFDVANPANPQLLRRLNLGAPGSYSEAAWDEKALKVLPDQGLVMVPVTSYDPATGESVSAVQLLDLDLTARDLRLRGKIVHAFEPRRSAALGAAVVSISQRALVSTDVADRDHPALLAQVLLAWPADRVFAAAAHLVHVENGGSWSGGWATARVTPADAVDTVLTEVELGDGEVVAAALREGKLYVVRELPGDSGDVQPMARIAWLPPGSGALKLDIYDASALPALPLLGSCEIDTGASSRLQTGEILWPQPNRPCLVIESQPYYFWWRGGPVIDVPVAIMPAVTDTSLTTGASASVSRIVDPGFGWPSGDQPRLVAFDVTNAAAPTASAPVDLGTNQTTLADGSAAGDGLVVIGADTWTEAEVTPFLSNSGGSALSHTLRVIDVPTSGSPVVRPAIDLPGSLFAVTELDRNGFLAFTQAWNDQGTSSLQASACDGRDAFLVDSIDKVDAYSVTAGGRRAFIASGDEIKRHRLDDTGRFVSEPALVIGWEAWDLQWLGGILLGTSGQRLFAAEGTMIDDWQFSMWGLNLDTITLAPGGDLLVPFGDYGTERLDR